MRADGPRLLRQAAEASEQLHKRLAAHAKDDTFKLDQSTATATADSLSQLSLRVREAAREFRNVLPHETAVIDALEGIIVDSASGAGQLQIAAQVWPTTAIGLPVATAPATLWRAAALLADAGGDAAPKGSPALQALDDVLTAPPPVVPETTSASAVRELKPYRPRKPLDDELGVDLTYRASKGDLSPIFGRDEELRRVVEILSNPTKGNAVLLGEAGVGKTAVAEALAQRIAAGDVPEALRNHHVVVWDLDALVAGKGTVGDLEESLKQSLERMRSHNGKLIVFADELHRLIGMGTHRGNSNDVAQGLKEPLLRGDLKLLAATTSDEWQKKVVQVDPAFARRFTEISLAQPSADDTLGILRALAASIEQQSTVRIVDDALVAATELGERLLPHRNFPDKAIDIVRTAAARANTERELGPLQIEQTERALARMRAERGFVARDASSSARSRLNALDEQIVGHEQRLARLHAQWNAERKLVPKIRRLEHDAAALHGQLDIAQATRLKGRQVKSLQRQIDGNDAARAKLVAELERIRDGQPALVSDVVDRPLVQRIVSEMTRVPVEKVTGAERQQLLTLESTLAERVVGQDHAIAAVASAIRRSRSGVGDPQRPVGSFVLLGPTGVGKTELARALAKSMSGDERQLAQLDMSEFSGFNAAEKALDRIAESSRKTPYGVVLLDEIEKADRAVYDLLLQALEEGRIVDSAGNVAHLRNNVVIMTSNATRGQLEQIMRPELRNRIDAIVEMNPLTAAQMPPIVTKLLQPVRERLATNGIQLEVSDQVLAALARSGMAGASGPGRSAQAPMGARPVRRAIQELVEDPAAQLLLREDPPAAGARLRIEPEGQARWVV